MTTGFDIEESTPWIVPGSDADQSPKKCIQTEEQSKHEGFSI